MNADRPFANVRQLAALIDHTLLKPEATESDISLVCKQALENQFATVCVNPCWIPLIHQHLKGSAVRACCVVGFPLGANRTLTKVNETSNALHDGASEIDMVINIGALRSGNANLVGAEIRELATAVHAAQAAVKVIIETCLLSDDQKRLACQLAQDAGADFVKTSTGFSTGGATEADVRLMRETVGPNLGVKASGGVRTLDAVVQMVRAGANRIGTSSGVALIQSFHSSEPGLALSQSGTGDGGSY